MQTQQGFRCEACGAEFTTREQLDQHKQQAHQQTQSFRCPACGAEFSTREQLEAHGRQAHQKM
jgi:uncharacterized C2H2 Zn-finger protein